ncbi:MAG: hypothetical protein WA864_05575 [Acetobacteraceae bacterium]
MARRRIIITIEGSDAKYRTALGLITRQLMRGQTVGRDAGRWQYRVDDPDAPDEPEQEDTQ